MFSNTNIELSQKNNKDKNRTIMRYPGCIKTHTFKKTNRPEKRKWFTTSPRSPLINDFNKIHNTHIYKPRQFTNISQLKYPAVPKNTLEIISNNTLETIPEHQPIKFSDGIDILNKNKSINIPIVSNEIIDNLTKDTHNLNLEFDSTSSDEEEIIYEKNKSILEDFNKNYSLDENNEVFENECEENKETKAVTEKKEINLDDKESVSEELISNEESVSKEDKTEDINNSIEFTSLSDSLNEKIPEENQGFFQRILSYFY